MVTITVQISGEIYHISTVEDLTKVQNMITQKFFEQSKDEEEIIERYFRDTSRLEIYDRVSDYPELLDEIVDRAIDSETDYQKLQQIGNRLQEIKDLLDETELRWLELDEIGG